MNIYGWEIPSETFGYILQNLERDTTLKPQFSYNEKDKESYLDTAYKFLIVESQKSLERFNLPNIATSLENTIIHNTLLNKMVYIGNRVYYDTNIFGIETINFNVLDKIYKEEMDQVKLIINNFAGFAQKPQVYVNLFGAKIK